MKFNETEKETPPDADQGTETHTPPDEAKPQVIQGNPDAGPEGTPPADFEERLVEENREYANIYRQNILASTAEVIKGLAMLHTMAMRGNKEAQQTMNVFWETLRAAGVAFPTNRKARRKLKALPGGKTKETENGGKLPA